MNRKLLKQFCWTVWLCCFSNLALAEYNGWFVAFEATDNQDRIETGYVYLASAYFNEDSLKSSNYLIRKFDQNDWAENDTIVYARTFIKYPVLSEDKLDTIYDYTTLHSDFMLCSQLKSIKITQRIPYSYIQSMSVLDTSGSLDWIYKEPLKQISFGGYFCERTFYIHKASKVTRKLEQDIAAYEALYRREESRLQDELSHSNGKELGEIEDALQALEERRDAQLDVFESMLVGEKVVSRGTCTC